MSTTRNLLIIIVVVALFVFAGWYLLSTSGSSAPTTPDAKNLTQDSAPAATAERQFIALLASLEPTKLDSSFLQNPRFTALINIAQPIVMEAPGRANPFAPLPK
jgi:hypothetical protein